MKEMTCIVCPRGCRLKIDKEKDFLVTGNRCEKGAEYGKKELTAPVRTLTSTVKITGGRYPRLPVKTDRPIPKDMVRAVMASLDSLCAVSPVHTGDVLIENILNTGANLVATRDI